MIISAINNCLATDATLVSLSGKQSLDIYPNKGYDDDVSPIIIYFWLPGVMNVDQYWMRQDSVLYRIVDTDAERCFAMGNRIIELLAQSTSPRTTIQSNLYVVKWIKFVDSQNLNPEQYEGFYHLSLKFDIIYVKL